MRGGVEEEALRRLRPGPDEYRRVLGFAESVASMVRGALGWAGCSVRVEGSVAKDTWLSGDVDVDVFALFPREYCLAMASERLIEYLEGWAARHGYMVERRYASHPYLRVGRGGLWADVVPGCIICRGERPLTPVDRTPLHTEYVRRVLREGWQRDEVRLLKAFMKAVGVYGAELEVSGFSGYLVELLIASYGSFRGVLRVAAEEWRPPVYVAPPGTSIEEARRLRRRYPDSVMYVPDPVDPERNAAAAVSARSLAAFITAARLYLENPIPELLDPRLEEHLEPPEPACRVVAVVVEPPEPEPPEVLAGVAARAARQAGAKLSSSGFTVLDTTARHWRGVGVGLIALLEDRLPPLLPHHGPPAWSRHAARFLSKYVSSAGPRGPWIGADGRLHVLRSPRSRDPVGLLEADESWVPGSARRRGWRVRVIRGEEAVRVYPGLERWIHWFAAREPAWIHAARRRLGAGARTS